MFHLSFPLHLLAVGGLLLEAASVVGASPIVARDGSSPSLPYDANSSQYCRWWLDLTSATSCSTLLDENFITLQEFIRWNPSITADCGNLVVGKSYCVEAFNEPPASPSPATSTTATTSPSTSSTSSTSSTISTSPASTSTTTALKTSTTSTTSTTTKAPTTTVPSNGIATPSPAQPSIVSNCDKFYLVKMGDTCDIITKAQGITLNQFLAWNPSAGSSCTGLWADAYACVSIIGHEPSVPATTTTAGNGIATPSPIQPNMVANCDSFYKVKSGDTCDIIASKNSVTSAQIISWNPSVGSGCTTLWLDYNICVSIIGHTPTTTSRAS